MYSVSQLAKKYFQYYYNASNSKGHGVHSPFVFEFIRFVKNDKKRYEVYPPIESLRKKLLSDPTMIEVNDFGAGSTVIKSNHRAVNKMAASSLKPVKFAQLLFRMVQFYQPKTILELGTSFGITTAYLAAGNPHATVITMEGADAIASIAAANFSQLDLHNIELIRGDFNQTLDHTLSIHPSIDFAFIDGNHRMEPTLEYFKKILEHSHDQTILVFDDIHWSQGMEDAWQMIQQHEAVTLTIDLFFIGIVFLRKDFKVKLHFSIRF